MEKTLSPFEVLNAINCNEHTEKKNGLTYLSWAWAWQIVKKNYPTASYTVYENADGWNYFTDGVTCWVKTGVTIEGLEHIEYLPVMDNYNRSIPAGKVTSFDVNKAIQRSLTKAAARHGLGLYIYAGEDLPEDAAQAQQAAQNAPKRTKRTTAPAAPASAPQEPANATPPRSLSQAQFQRLATAEANGQRTKSGEQPRQWWIDNYNPSDDEIRAFDQSVDMLRSFQ